MKKNILTLALVLFSAAAFAETTTGTITFSSSNVAINSASVTGTDDQNQQWTITTVGTTSYTGNTGYYQVGSSSKPATSITFTATFAQQHTFTAVSAKFGGFSSTAGDISIKVGNTEVATGSLNATTDVTVASSNSATGTSITVTISNISKGVKCYNISYSYDGSSGGSGTVDPEPEQPTSQTIAEWLATNPSGTTSLTLTNAVVMGYRKGSSTTNIYLYDGEQAMIVYGYSLPTDITYGNTFSGTITGTYATYNGLPEISSASIQSGYTLGTATHPLRGQEINVADAPSYVGKLVCLQAVRFNASSLSNYRVTLSDDDGSIVLYDTYGALTGVSFDTEKDAYVTGIVGYYSSTSTYQIYVSGTDYISYEQPKQTPTASWKFEVPADYAGVYPSFITNSDGQKHYSSTAAAVATVAADGTVSLVAEGETTVSCFADATAFFKAASEKSYLLKIVAAAVQTVTGDVNMDGSVDVSDISTLAEYIFGNTPALFNRTAADANNDGTIDVSDISTIAEIIFQQ